jgi:single-stranded DNA-binding protein
MSDKKWRGVQINEVRLMGVLPNDPQFITSADNLEWAFFELRTMVLETGANGQFQEADVDVPVIANTPDKVRVIKQYVKAGRQLYITGYYKNWDANGTKHHAIFTTGIKLGRSPFTNNPSYNLPE